jgi:hypothetical protein
VAVVLHLGHSLIGGAICSVFLAWSVAVCADGGAPVELEWDAPPDCSSKNRVLGEVARLIGTAPRRVHARALVDQQSATAFQVRIELRGEVEGARQLSAHSCDSAARAAALIIALAIDPQAASVVTRQLEQAETERAPSKAESSDGAPAEATPAHASDQTAERDGALAEPLHGVLLSGITGEQARVPGLAVGALLGGGVRDDWVRFDLGLYFVPSAHAAVAGSPGQGADFTAGGLSARFCPRALDSELGVFMCLGAHATRIWGEGTGVPETLNRYGDVWSAGLGAKLRWPGASAWAAELDLELIVPFTRPAFAIENLGPVYRVPAFGFTGALALAYEL